MTKNDIEKAVDVSFDKALSNIKPAINRELYPTAFANEHSWHHVQTALELNNAAIRSAVKDALITLLTDEQER